jgi:outer membrane lipoprotein carrier protein
MLKDKLLMVVCGMLVAGNLLAQKSDFVAVSNVKEVETKLMNASSQIKTISCDFIQKKHLEYLDEVIESKGKFIYKAPGQLRWEYVDPFSYLIILSNGMFTVVDGSKKSEFDLKKNKAFKELNDIIVSSVNGSLIESKRFAIDIKENKTHYQVTLNPLNDEMKKVLSSIELYFSKSDLSVERTRMIESQQDYTEILFVKRVFNQAIAANAFSAK